MSHNNFANLSEMAAFIAAQGIVQADIQLIHPYRGRWYLVWW